MGAGAAVPFAARPHFVGAADRPRRASPSPPARARSRRRPFQFEPRLSIGSRSLLDHAVPGTVYLSATNLTIPCPPRAADRWKSAGGVSSDASSFQSSCDAQVLRHVQVPLPLTIIAIPVCGLPGGVTVIASG